MKILPKCPKHRSNRNQTTEVEDGVRLNAATDDEDGTDGRETSPGEGIAGGSTGKPVP